MIKLVVAAALLQVVLATPPTDTDCGKPYVAAKPKVVGGVEATPYSWPWQVQIRYFGGHFCGATLVSPDWIVTAAHCFKGFSTSYFDFRVGRHSTASSNEPYEQKSNLKTLIMHESYNAISSNNDIAVVRMYTPFKYNNYVKAACLPTRTTELPAGTTCYVTGWGDLSDGGATPSKLMQVAVPIIARSTCNQYGWYSGSITNQMICAGYEKGGKDACQGDSGGPLVSKIGDKWELYGVVSWGDGCAAARRPGIYTNVVYFNNWIRSKITQVEREEEIVNEKFRPIPYGQAFRELSKMLVEKGEILKSDLPNADEWM